MGAPDFVKFEVWAFQARASWDFEFEAAPAASFWAASAGISSCRTILRRVIHLEVPSPPGFSTGKRYRL